MRALQRFLSRRKWIHIEKVMSLYSLQLAKELVEKLYGTVFRKTVYTENKVYIQNTIRKKVYLAHVGGGCRGEVHSPQRCMCFFGFIYFKTREDDLTNIHQKQWRTIQKQGRTVTRWAHNFFDMRPFSTRQTVGKPSPRALQRFLSREK